MKNIVLVIALCVFTAQQTFAQEDSLNTISKQIKTDRDKQLKELSHKLNRNEEEVSRLTALLSAIDEKKTKEKLNTLEDLQKALDNRLKILESSPKTRVRWNAQLAFTELLSIQRDIQPADLFLASEIFFTQAASISQLQNYEDFSTWKKEYDKWYVRQKGADKMIDFIHNSLSLITNVSNKVPLYGSVVQTAVSGISSIVTTFGKRNKELADKTPQMLTLLNLVSQFESQKSVIDHEWKQINTELRQLQHENGKLVKEQLVYYGLDTGDYKQEFVEETLDSKRDIYKNTSRKRITEKLIAQDTMRQHSSKWLAQVETYMYKVQSLRLRFGQLTARMFTNINRYEELVSTYSDSQKFPAAFTENVRKLSTLLAAVKSSFNTTFNPQKYIEDSAIMYLEDQPNS